MASRCTNALLSCQGFRGSCTLFFLSIILLWLPLAGEKWIESPPAITSFDSLHVRFNMVTKELLQEIFSYDNGNLYWKTVRCSKLKVGQKAGWVGKKNYLYVRVNYKAYAIHRLVWIIHNGDIDNGKIIDHIDRNPTNNKIENLRIATHTQNNQNSSKRTTNTSGYKNVYWSTEKSRWLVKCNVNGLPKYAGSYKLLDEAVQAAIQLRKKFHAEFAQDDITC